MIVNIIAWLIFGAVAGWLAGYIMKRNTQLNLADVVLGIIGGVVGGWLGNLLIPGDVNAFSPLWIVFAVVGALILAFLYEKFTGKSAQ